MLRTTAALNEAAQAQNARNCSRLPVWWPKVAQANTPKSDKELQARPKVLQERPEDEHQAAASKQQAFVASKSAPRAIHARKMNSKQQQASSKPLQHPKGMRHSEHSAISSWHAAC